MTLYVCSHGIHAYTDKYCICIYICTIHPHTASKLDDQTQTLLHTYSMGLFSSVLPWPSVFHAFLSSSSPFLSIVSESPVPKQLRKQQPINAFSVTVFLPSLYLRLSRVPCPAPFLGLVSCSCYCHPLDLSRGKGVFAKRVHTSWTVCSGFQVQTAD